ncbi:MAG: hypothetical protein HYT06_01485 [Candidatus Levybacteria bacterium]|nr:hypothetical protein [Candidatus Levybacteria bacterium]
MDLNKDIKDIHINLNSTTVNILYRKYKSFLLPLLVIFGCLILFFAVVMPQLQGVLDAKQKEEIAREKLEKLKANYNLLSNMDEIKLGQDLQSLSRGLSSNKDFAGIINSISYNSLNAAVVLSDFEFVVGDISNKEPNTTPFPSLRIEVRVSGEPTAILNFIKKLYASTPLVEATSIAISNNSAILRLQFYYKAFPQGQISNETLVSAFSQKENDLIDKITSWGSGVANASLILNSFEQQASNSSSLNATASAQSP